MPDHMHMIWLGKTMDADQLLAMRFFRRYMQLVLSPYQFQKQAYDHVLREEDRARDAFRSICFYVLENPVRAGMVNSAEKWAYSGCLMVGLPDLHPLDARFERVFWQRYADEVRGSMLNHSV
jgi:putative transposase